MKKFQTLIVLAVFVSQLVNPFTLNTKAAVLGDNYPSQWQTGWGPDTWGMYKRQCTSFVAFRLSSVMVSRYQQVIVMRIHGAKLPVAKAIPLICKQQ